MHRTLQWLTKLAPVLIGAILVVGMLIFFNLDRVPIHNELIALYLLPRPEKLTELYFSDNAKLPKSVAEKQVIRFAFVIHNLETNDYQYDYEVYTNSKSKNNIVDRGSVVVKNGQYYIKNENFAVEDTPGGQKVVVELVNKEQSIDFWIGK